MNIILALSAGFVLLVAGGELLVRGAVRMAERLGMSPLLVGLTIVGFGTSAPELMTSVQGAIQGSPGIAVGNIVGSNIANILLILGISALISPIPLTPAALRRDGVLVLATAVIFTGIAWWWTLDRVVGGLLVGGLISYLVYAYRQEKQTAAVHTAAYDKGEALDELVTHHPKRHPRSKLLDLTIAGAQVVAGLVLVVLGGKYFVTGAIELARSFAISETVIGLTIVAVGTSMPELVTSVVAAYRKHSDVALGNVLGSNIYNLLGIGGLTALISPTDVPDQILGFDNPVMIAASAALLLFAWTNRRIGRREGGLLLAGYVAYVLVLVL